MFRISGRRPPTAPDEATIERVLDGAPIDDLPDALRPLGEVLAAATSAPGPAELEGSTAAAAAFVTARAAAGRARRARTAGVSVFTVLLLAVSTGTAVAAARGALPDPMQQVAYEALGVVGISVPSIDDGSTRHPVVVTDAPSTPPVPAVSGPSSGGDPSAGIGTTGTGAPIAGTGSSGAGSSGPGATVAPPEASSTSGDGAPNDTGPPAVPPGQLDKPIDRGGGSDGPINPSNPDAGHDPGGDAEGIPPGHAEKG
jgi:hypothetical protein